MGWHMKSKSVDIDADVIKQYRGLIRDCHRHIDAGDLKKIREALDITIKIRATKQEKITGVPVVLHSIMVARVVASDLGLGKTAIIAALLSDIIDETEYALHQLESRFGREPVEILRSLTKINSIDNRKANLHAESFRKLILNLVGDVQVLLIKIAERLVVMRNLSAAREKIRLQVATETKYLHAPLAHRLGLYNIKSELEDRSFECLEKESYDFIENKLKKTKQTRDRFIREFIRPIKKKLDNLGLNYQIKGRLKSVYSIWNKMQKQQVSFEEVFDLFAIRIIVKARTDEEKMLCWQVYSVVTDIYTPNPERLRDWVSIPKANGYESLHTTVASPKGRWVEVQIRTERMNEVAEKGLAAHWKYKGGKLDRNLDEWLKNMREVLDSLEIDPGDYDNQLKQTLYTGEIFVFTPKGDLKRLPKGATVLDFAFEIHSDVGLKCVGGKVNHKNVSIKHPLKNGDMVEITTSKNQKAKTDWLKFVITSKAKTKIKQSLNEEKLREAEIGKEILKRRLRNWKINFSDATVKELLTHYDLKYAQDLYYLISQEKIILGNIKDFLQQETKEVAGYQNVDNDAGHSPNLSAKRDQSEDFLVIEGKIENVDYHLAKCCHPVIGNKIFGFVTINEGIKIHRMDCPNARQLISKYPYRVVQVKWSESSGKSVINVKLKISGSDEIGIVNRITDVITQDLKVDMQSVNFKTSENRFEGELSLKILNKDHFDIINRKLMKIKGVTKVVRIT